MKNGFTDFGAERFILAKAACVDRSSQIDRGKEPVYQALTARMIDPGK
jgi:hypothetical protein